MNARAINRIGLALVFLANGLSAFFTPQEFIDLIQASFVSGLLPLPIGTFLVVIGVNDILVAGLLLFNVRPYYVVSWAMIWLVAVMAVIAEPLGILEHLGFFAMALALWAHGPSNKVISNH